ncbi:Uncharacterised protein [Actinobacillus equuli]|nr:Uncharacterised protein [Actinobacillus equuli]
MIHMARRDGTWQESDCELIRQWFTNKLKSLEIMVSNYERFVAI